MLSHEKQRYKEKSAVELINGRLKEDFVGNFVMVKGSEKMMIHCMFDLLSIYAAQLIKITAS